MTRIEKFVFALTALLLMLSAFSAGLTYPTQWDYLSYHLPSALQRFHLTTFTPGHRLSEVIAGFPPAPHTVQGFLVWLTGEPKFTNALGWLSFLLLVGMFYWIVKDRRKVAWATVLFVTVPFVFLHLMIPYVDLWAGVWMALAVYSGILVLRNPPTLKTGFIFALSASVAALSKMQNWPVIACLCIFMGAVWIKRALFSPEKAGRRVPFLLVFVFFLTIFWPFRNWLMFSNPTHPWAPPLIEKFVPPEQFMIINDSQSAHVKDATPEYLWSMPQSVKFLASVFEVGRVQKPFVSYNHDMWMGGPKSMHHRVGGWGLWLVLLLIFWSYSWFKRERANAAICLSGLGFLFACVSVIPQSHELRYWIFFPVAMILCLVDFHFSFITRHQKLLLAVFLCTVVSIAGRIKLTHRTVYTVAPTEAREFWLKADPEQTYNIDSPPGDIFWAGPKFNSFRVQGSDF
jgi:hypothetical protein